MGRQALGEYVVLCVVCCNLPCFIIGEKKSDALTLFDQISSFGIWQKIPLEIPLRRFELQIPQAEKKCDMILLLLSQKRTLKKNRYYTWFASTKNRSNSIEMKIKKTLILNWNSHFVPTHRYTRRILRKITIAKLCEFSY